MKTTAIAFVLTSAATVVKALTKMSLKHATWPSVSTKGITIVSGMDNFVLAARLNPGHKFAVVENVSQVVDSGIPIVDAYQAKPGMWVRKPMRLVGRIDEVFIEDALRIRLAVLQAKRKHKRMLAAKKVKKRSSKSQT